MHSDACVVLAMRGSMHSLFSASRASRMQLLLILLAVSSQAETYSNSGLRPTSLSAPLVLDVRRSGLNHLAQLLADSTR